MRSSLTVRFALLAAALPACLPAAPAGEPGPRERKAAADPCDYSPFRPRYLPWAGRGRAPQPARYVAPGAAELEWRSRGGGRWRGARVLLWSTTARLPLDVGQRSDVKLHGKRGVLVAESLGKGREMVDLGIVWRRSGRCRTTVLGLRAGEVSPERARDEILRVARSLRRPRR